MSCPPVANELYQYHQGNYILHCYLLINSYLYVVHTCVCVYSTGQSSIPSGGRSLASYPGYVASARHVHGLDTRLGNSIPHVRVVVCMRDLPCLNEMETELGLGNADIAYFVTFMYMFPLFIRWYRNTCLACFVLPNLTHNH